jgi:hypothetical protein
MNDVGDWVQSNWFELGTLLIQCALLAVVAWYGSGMLRFLRAFSQYQDQFRQRISETIPTALEDRHGFSSAWHSTMRWLQEPWGRGSSGPFRRAIRWFQSPMGS